MAKRAKKRNAWGPFGTRETYRVTRAPGRANEHSYKGYKVWQTWPEGFKTSADPESTFDTLKDVKRFIDWQKKNPGKPGSAFKRCVAAVSEKGGAGDPRAVCAAAGRKKYGAKKYAAMAQAGKKRAERGGNLREFLQANPGWRNDIAYQLADAEGHIMTGFQTQGEAFREAQSVAASSGKRIEVVWRGRDGDYRSRWFGKRAARGNPREKISAYEAGRKALASAASKLGTVNLTPSIAQREDWRHAWKEFMAGWNAEKRRSNPSEEAAAVYEEFHGRPSSEIVTVTEKIHYHKNLAALGELRTLVIVARDGGRVTLTRFKKAILCTNEAKNQMFIRGGDQAVDPGAFGIRNVHEVETLGKVVELAYFTTKDHLGDEGGTAIYFHVAGETNENGKRKMAGWAPDLIYHTIDERLEFSGGSYTIRAEGVDK